MTRSLSGVWVIARREMATRARSKAFGISTAVMLLSAVLGIVIPTVFLGDAQRYAVMVVATGGDLSAAITEQAAAGQLTVDILPANDRAAATASVDSGAVAAAVVDVDEIIWGSDEDPALAQVLRNAISQVTVSRRAAEIGMAPTELAALLAPVTPTVTRLHPQTDRTPQMIIALVGMILLYIALNLYGSFVLMGVVEEKSSRVVEVLLARVRASHLLAGKVTGIGLLGIGQFAALAAVAATTLRTVRPPDLPPTTLPLIAGIVMWFILGYAFYRVLYGALGALASRTEDTQAAVAPLSVFLLLVYLGAFAVLGNPHEWWVTAGSLFPPTAPMIMPLRSALTTVPAWQMALSVMFMLAAIALLVRAGGRLYRGAVLHTSGRLRIAQAWRGTNP